MLEAFRTIRVPIQVKEKTIEVEVPFNVELMERVEQTIFKAAERPWWRVRPNEKNVIEAFEEFCQHYLPGNFDYRAAQPTFCALFFSSVKSELMRSIEDCMISIRSTSASEKPTAGKPADRGSASA